MGSAQIAKGLPDGKFKVRIFDFGGQEYYHDTHHMFFTNNTAYFLLWDQKRKPLCRSGD
ncbi:MAG: hypothetical protein IPP17_00655 [Bacteroidetes bacterium]|nr:hypothetical protein [Bacteroidota bacterium]